MKQRKEFKRAETVQELTAKITNIIGKDPKKATKVVQFWIRDDQKPVKKAS